MKHRKERARRLILFGVLVLVIFSNSMLVDLCIRNWETPILTERDMKNSYEVGVVLGGGMVNYDAVNDRLAFEHNVDRIFQAVDLYYAGKIKNILISGGSGSLLYPNVIESLLLKKYLIRIGVPDSVVLVDSTSNNTHENAVNTTHILETQFPEQNYLLITSSMHMKRAKDCFLRQGIECDYYATNKLVGDKRRSDLAYMLTPNVSALSKWKLLNHEIIGYAMYFLMGYL